MNVIIWMCIFQYDVTYKLRIIANEGNKIG